MLGFGEEVRGEVALEARGARDSKRDFVTAGRIDGRVDLAIRTQRKSYAARFGEEVRSVSY